MRADGGKSCQAEAREERGCSVRMVHPSGVAWWLMSSGLEHCSGHIARAGHISEEDLQTESCRYYEGSEQESLVEFAS